MIEPDDADEAIHPDAAAAGEADSAAGGSGLRRVARNPLVRRGVLLVVAGVGLGATIGYTVSRRDTAVVTQPLRGVSQVIVVSLRSGEPRGTSTELAVSLAPLPGVVEVGAPEATTVKVYISSKAVPQQISAIEARLSGLSEVASFVLQPYAR
jgi:hypothetical protein